MPESTEGSCRPTSTNTTPFRMYDRAFHTAYAWIRTRGEKNRVLWRLR